ncbi:trypsin-like peptidase domain-containing protein [Peribacillus simplex]|uniref:trypsin-like peptidase domain-containing protein n=1 Tax=Peribacillus simplex TaxID=1478 RepID=UPI003D015C1A
MSWRDGISNLKYDELIQGFHLNFALKHSKTVAEYRQRVGNTVLSKQAKLFHIEYNHPVASGSVTFIKYKGYYFAVTNEHCVRKKDVENYTVYVPSKKTDERLDNQRIEVKLNFLHADNDIDLAVFQVDSDALKDTKRSFIDLFPTSFANIKEETQIILIGVPGERLEYLYPKGEDDEDDYTQGIETIMYNHITYFTTHEGVEENVHQISFDPQQTAFGEGTEETKAFVQSAKGMSGSPAFIHSYLTLNINQVRFLGITSNADPQYGRAYVIDLCEVIEFLDNVIENV